MTGAENTRATRKAATRQRILESASRRLRSEGLKGAGVNPVMADAGLTRGSFYAHFANKETLAREAFSYAIANDQAAWLDGDDDNWSNRVARLAASYLTSAHRDAPERGCAIAALASQQADAPEGFKQHFSETLVTTLMRIADDRPERLDDAIAILAMLTGGINLARNLPDQALSDRVLAVCQNALKQLADNPD